MKNNLLNNVTLNDNIQTILNEYMPFSTLAFNTYDLYIWFNDNVYYIVKKQGNSLYDVLGKKIIYLNNHSKIEPLEIVIDKSNFHYTILESLPKVIKGLDNIINYNEIRDIFILLNSQNKVKTKYYN